MERLEYFAHEIEMINQKERDAKLLVRVPGRLLLEATKIVELETKKAERKMHDFV